jgi:hypothetical protein
VFSTFLIPRLETYKRSRGESMLASRMTNVYGAKTGSSNLKRHIMALHCDVWDENAQYNGWTLDLQSTKSVEWQDRPREEFDVGKFHQWLVDFIVADDHISPFCDSLMVLVFLTALLPQVINIIECPEFCSLLLLL